MSSKDKYTIVFLKTQIIYYSATKIAQLWTNRSENFFIPFIFPIDSSGDKFLLRLDVIVSF